MNQVHSETPVSKSAAIAQWRIMLQDITALLARPGAHHRALLDQAHALHKSHTITSDDLNDLLEQADGALAYAVETLLDIDYSD